MHARQTTIRELFARRGKLRLALLPVILLAAGLAVVLTSSPASAGAGAPSAAGVQPTEVNLGGQPNDCAAVGSAASYELRIENPQSGPYTDPAGPAGVTFTLTVTEDDLHLDFALDGPAVVFDVVIKGGQKSTHYDFDGSSDPGPVQSDAELHAPTKGNGSNLYNISHMSMCYESALPVSGTVYIDEDPYDGLRNAGEGPDVPRQITAYSDTGAPVAMTMSSAVDGSYTLLLGIGSTYRLCEEAIPGVAQTQPASNAICATLGSSEPGGYEVTVSTEANLTGFDFGNEGICGQDLSAADFNIAGVFELFENGNGEFGCVNKIGSLYVDLVNGIPTLALPLVGSGEVAGIGTITKQFASPDDFEPLTYSPTIDGSYEVLPWCVQRDKVASDGDQFELYITQPDPPALPQYPSLLGVTDPVSGDPSVACKVWEDDNLQGIQTTIVLVQEDPFWQ